MNPNDMTNSLITIFLSQICWFSCILRKITIYTSVTLILVRLSTVYVHHTRVLLHLASENGCHFFMPRTQRCRLIGAYKVVVLDSTLWCSTFDPILFILYKKHTYPVVIQCFILSKNRPNRIFQINTRVSCRYTSVALAVGLYEQAKLVYWLIHEC